MEHTRMSRWLLLLAAAVVLAVPASSDPVLAQQVTKKQCKKTCKQEKKGCLKGYKGLFKGLKKECNDKQCKKGAKTAFKLGKRVCKDLFKSCKNCCKGTTTLCTVTVCGNAHKTPSEECDDGNLIDGDGCDSNCTLTDCGNGIVTSSEQCDDGSANSDTPDTCRTSCKNPACGDGITDTGETCDDGSNNSDTTPGACRTDCTLTITSCGDGTTSSGEACDDGNTTACDGCAVDCSRADDICGDGIEECGEACDDGNTAACDGCAADCSRVDDICGDGIEECGEACDNGAANSDTMPDACRTSCTLPSCGDGTVDSGEDCDRVGVGCSPDCTFSDCLDNNDCQVPVPPCEGGQICNLTTFTCQDELDAPTNTMCDLGSSACLEDHCDGMGTCIAESLCCANFSNGLLSFETSLAVGDCGRRGNFRCSNNADTACATNAECDLGTCFDPPGICSGDFGVTCSGNGTPCTGTCGQVGGYTPLVCGGLYTGGGGNSVPLPLPIPDMGLAFSRIADCNAETGVLTLVATTPDEKPRTNCTQGRTCSGSGAFCVLDDDCPASQTCDDNCLFGPPLPIPNSNSTPTSVCVINTPDEATSGRVGGTAQCDGGSSALSLPLRSTIHLAGDILSTSVGPFDVPGIQACPLCSAQCSGGSNDLLPCEDNSECPGGACDGTENCIGGPSHGNTCTPGTSGPANLNAGFPTSHDCPPQASQSITDAIGGLPVAFALSSGTQVLNAVDQPELRRTFCGFCRDVNMEGSNCFDGDPDPGMTGGCPDSNAQANCDPASGTTTGCGAAVSCDDDSDCTAPYESCAQRSPGAFSAGATTRIEAFGATDGQCLGDGGTHSANLVSIFCIPPTFDATVDSAGDLPGPGAAMLQGDARIEP